MFAGVLDGKRGRARAAAIVSAALAAALVATTPVVFLVVRPWQHEPRSSSRDIVGREVTSPSGSSVHSCRAPTGGSCLEYERASAQDAEDYRTACFGEFVDAECPTEARIGVCAFDDRRGYSIHFYRRGPYWEHDERAAEECRLQGGTFSLDEASHSRGLPPSPSRADITAAMRAIGPSIAACANGRSGTVSMRIVFESSGHVTSAEVLGGSSPPVAVSCMTRAAREARVPPFSQPSAAVVYPFPL
jgi:hypothetical protein